LALTILFAGTPDLLHRVANFGCKQKRIKGNPMPPNNALLTDAFSSLRYACGAAKRER
jgi:hypothetical protein